MPKFGAFSSCMCKDADVSVVSEPRQAVQQRHIEKRTEEYRTEYLSSITPTRDSSDVKVSFCDSGDDYFEENEGVRDKPIAFLGNTPESASQYAVGTSLQSKTVTFRGQGLANDQHENVISTKTSKQKSKISILHEKVRTARIALRKVHAKIKLDLNDMQKMRDVLKSSKCAVAANLPDVITEESNCSEGDFMRKFRQLFDSAQSEITAPTRELEGLTNEYAMLLAKHGSESDQSDAGAASSQVQSESQRLVLDSSRILSMLKKAMKIATVEYRLKLVFLDDTSSSKQTLPDLEAALLDMQRLKSDEGLEFKEDASNVIESPSCHAVRDTFSKLFPRERILKLEKKSKVKLAELHIAELENRNRRTDAKSKLRKAIESRNVKDIESAIDWATKAGIPKTDESMHLANETLQDISSEVQRWLNSMEEAIKSSSSKTIEKYLEKADILKIPNNHPLVLKAISVVKDLKEREENQKSRLTELKQAMKGKNADDIQRLLALVESDPLPDHVNILDEAKSLLSRLQKDDHEIKKDSIESARIRLVTSLESDRPEAISETLLRAKTAGLSNCVEIMAAKTKLVQLQKDRGQYAVEIQKMENYLDKLAGRASDNAATVDLIMTLERALTVAESLEVSSEVKHRARGALHVLEARKEKVKNVKDELQRAVMECRHEAITCAVAEAESLPYFLTFDPLDGQIAAILEYAKNKITPSFNASVVRDPYCATKRVKSNLKRAMRGNSSDKLESAISLYRKTLKLDTTSNNREGVPRESKENDLNANLLRRAERKVRRLQRQEKIAEREWINIRNTLRGNLKEAMKENDRAELWRAVYQFKRELGSNMDKDDERLLHEARKQLREVTVKQFKSNLSSALQDRDVNRLRHALVELESPSLAMFPMSIDGKCKDDIAKAKKLLSHLKDMERIKKSVSEMSRSQLAEIHRYPNPPACVRAVMTATYVLLGENEKDLKDWTAVLRLLVKMGREALTRRVAVCSPIHIPISTAHRVREILSDFTQNQVQDINKGAAVFFAWANCIVTEVFDRHKDDPTARILPKPTRPAEKPKLSKTDPLKSEFWHRLSRPRSSVAARSFRRVKVNPRPTSALN